MAYSTIPAVVDRMLVVLAARAGLAGVLIADGIPADMPTESERVFVDDPINWRADWAAIGQRRVTESYTIKVAVETFMPGSDRAACRLRLFALIAEVQQAIVVDATLPGLMKHWAALPNGGDPRLFPTDDGWLGAVTLNFDCSARIQAS